MDTSVITYRAWLAELSERPVGGIAFEAWTLQHLTDAGWTVRATPTSGDYGADVLATDPQGVRWAVQTKNWAKPVGIRAVQEVYAAQRWYDCERAMVWSTRGFTDAAIALAAKCGVVLRVGVR